MSWPAFFSGEAGVIDGKYISGSNSYGAQARGSGCKSEIVFSDRPIDFPHLTTADILVAMSQGAYDIYCEDVKEDLGSSFMTRAGDSKRGIKCQTDGHSCHRICREEIEKQAGGQHRSSWEPSSRSQRLFLPRPSERRSALM